ncbi:BnaC02g19620D [Brassica napus]|uniref:BnaC02g19620D protein n=1 Tax=Brassica napus TaxID=3708 RepID=A0A078I1N3_BRANA|nr:BnaC02g19620D [Brassica napus]
MAPKGRDEEVDGLVIVLFGCLIAFIIMLPFALIIWLEGPTPVPEIEVASMDFTIQDITHTHLSATWDLLTRIPDTLPDTYNVFKETFKLPCFTRILPLLSPLDTGTRISS